MKGRPDSPAFGHWKPKCRYLSSVGPLFLSIFLPITFIFDTSFANDTGMIEAIEREMASTFEEISPSVFKVHALVKIKDSSGNSSWGRNIGSGVVFDSAGHLMTTCDVVFGARSIEVVSGAGIRYDAKLVGIDPETNLALLKIHDGSVKPVTVGDSDLVKAGHWAIILGNTFDVMSPVFGMVMGILERDGWIRVNVKSYPGNSGAPVFDSSGRMVGIVTAALAEPPVLDLQLAQRGLRPNSSLSGVTFVLPVNLAMEAAKRVMTEGKFGWIGLKIYSTPVLVDGGIGFRVIDVVGEGPADTAGVRKGDIMISCQGKRFNDVRKLIYSIRSIPIGKKLELELSRHGKTFVTHVEVGEISSYMK